LVGETLVDILVLRRMDVVDPPHVGPVTAIQACGEVTHELRATDVANAVRAFETAFLSGAEELDNVFLGVGDLAFQRQCTEGEIAVVIQDQVVATGLLSIDIQVGVADLLDLERIRLVAAGIAVKQVAERVRIDRGAVAAPQNGGAVELADLVTDLVIEVVQCNAEVAPGRSEHDAYRLG